MAAANAASSEIPRRILWSEYYGVFCPADTKAVFNCDPRLGSDAAGRHKGPTVHPAIITNTKGSDLLLGLVVQPRPVPELQERCSKQSAERSIRGPRNRAFPPRAVQGEQEDARIPPHLNRAALHKVAARSLEMLPGRR